MRLYGSGIIATQCEELDQFAGPNEIRKVTQSTMRGGNIFWDFRTFNPPISMNNWANEYVNSIEDRDNTLVVRNTYLDVPKEWLGPVFIEEAEELKELNYKAYQHEYLGIPVGTGGNVFPNVEDIDTDQIITIPGTDTKVRMCETFDNIFNGIDWGFAKDPFRFVKMHFDRRHLDLYIYRELDSHQTRNITIFEELYDERKMIDRNELVTADSAEPKSIADFKAYGAYIRGAVKGPDSVRYGIKWLQGLRHIYIDRRKCPKTFQEFVAYEYEQDRDGNFISAYPDENNHGIDATRYALEKFYSRRGN